MNDVKAPGDISQYKSERSASIDDTRALYGSVCRYVFLFTSLGRLDSEGLEPVRTTSLLLACRSLLCIIPSLTT